MNDIIPSQAVILAGGKSSRFEPFNSDSHKSNFKLMGKSIIKMTVQSLLESGVDKIIIVKSPNDTNIEESLAD